MGNQEGHPVGCRGIWSADWIGAWRLQTQPGRGVSRRRRGQGRDAALTPRPRPRRGDPTPASLTESRARGGASWAVGP